MSIGFGINYQSKLNFKEIFSNPLLSIFDLLAIDEIVKEVKASNKIFTKQLIKKQNLVKDLIDITIRPGSLKQNERDIPIIYPFLGIQILCSQQEEFYTFLFRNSQQKNYEFTKYNLEYENIKPTVVYIFEILQTNKRINDTAAGYLAKLVEQIIVYQKGVELFGIIRKYQNIQRLLFQHCYCTSIMNILRHLIFIQNEQISQSKEQLIEKMFLFLLQQPRTRQLVQKLDNVIGIIQQLIQKYNQKSQYQRKSFFLMILKFIISTQNVKTIKQLIEKQRQNEEIVSSALDILLIFLKFEKLEKKKQEQRKKNLKVFIQKNYYEFELIEEFENVVQILLCNLQQQQHYLSNLNRQKIKPSILKLIFLIQQILYLNQRFAGIIINSPFIKVCVKLLIQFPFNNFLHNSIKEIIILSLKTERAIDICYKQSTLIDFIIQCFSNPIHNKIGFINQLYHIITAIELARSKRSILNLIISQYPNWQQILTKTYSKIKQNYERFLGGENPKMQQQLITLNWKNLNTQNLEPGEDTPAFINPNLMPNNNNNNNNSTQSSNTMIDFSSLNDNQYNQDQQQQQYQQSYRKNDKKMDIEQTKESFYSDKNCSIKTTEERKQEIKEIKFNCQQYYEDDVEDPDDDCYLEQQPMSVGRNRNNRW